MPNAWPWLLVLAVLCFTRAKAGNLLVVCVCVSAWLRLLCKPLAPPEEVLGSNPTKSRANACWRQLCATAIVIACELWQPLPLHVNWLVDCYLLVKLPPGVIVCCSVQSLSHALSQCRAPSEAGVVTLQQLKAHMMGCRQR
jgi:hypothetical protein